MSDHLAPTDPNMDNITVTDATVYATGADIEKDLAFSSTPDSGFLTTDFIKVCTSNTTSVEGPNGEMQDIKTEDCEHANGDKTSSVTTPEGTTTTTTTPEGAKTITTPDGTTTALDQSVATILCKP